MPFIILPFYLDNIVSKDISNEHILVTTSLRYVEIAANLGLEYRNKLLGLRNNLIDWSVYNQYGESMMIEGPIYNEESDGSYRIIE